MQEKIAKEIMTTGLLFGSNPFNCTIDNSSGLVIKGIYALDNLSDEIGVTHETVNGEIVEEERLYYSGGKTMQEKIAKEIYEGFTGLPWPPTDAENNYTVEHCMHHAAAILALPVEGCGEVKEKCPETCSFGNHIKRCARCKGTGFISRPPTLGELLERDQLK